MRHIISSTKAHWSSMELSSQHWHQSHSILVLYSSLARRCRNFLNFHAVCVSICWPLNTHSKVMSSE